MPYLIGTSGFFELDDVGIKEFGSEGVYVYGRHSVVIFTP